MAAAARAAADLLLAVAENDHSNQNPYLFNTLLISSLLKPALFAAASPSAADLSTTEPAAEDGVLMAPAGRLGRPALFFFGAGAEAAIAAETGTGIGTANSIEESNQYFWVSMQNLGAGGRCSARKNALVMQLVKLLRTCQSMCLYRREAI